MPRRRPVEVHINHERWLVSYADFITLLFAFFVVMYSISQVNEGKYKVLSNTLLDAFNESPVHTLRTNPSSDSKSLADLTKLDVTQLDAAKLKPVDAASDGTVKKTAELPELTDQFTEQFAELLKSEVIQLHANELWLEIDVQAKVLFGSANAEPSAEAERIFAEVAVLLKNYDNPIQVEGFTDNIPIKSDLFPSNWELSAARAATVVKLLANNGVAPQRLSAVGYGEFQPIADNTTAEGRAENRRVVLMIARDRAERPRVSQPEDIRALSQPATDAVQPVVEPESSAPLVESTQQVAPEQQLEPVQQSAPEPEQEPEPEQQSESTRDRLAPVGNIKPVETETGGLLFSSDPNLPRTGN